MTWIRLVRRWTLIPWLFLSVGILMGSQWAYMELGMGRLLGLGSSRKREPLAVAYGHGLYSQHHRAGTAGHDEILEHGHDRHDVFPDPAGYTHHPQRNSSQRAQFRQEFHRSVLSCNAGPGSGRLLFLLWRRREALDENVAGSAWISRESAFLSNNWLFTGVAFATLWGTYFPVISELFSGVQIAVAAPYFEKVNGPLFLLLFLTMGIGPMLKWRSTSLLELRRKLRFPVGTAVLAGLVSYWLVPTDSLFALLGFSVCALVAAATIQEYGIDIRARQRAQGENFVEAARQLLQRQGHRYGGYLVHLGMVLIGLAIVGNEFYQEVQHVTLAQEESHVTGNYTLTYKGMVVEDKANLTQFRAVLGVENGNGLELNPLQPQRNVYFKNPDAPTSEVGLRTTWAEDLYVVLNGWEDGAVSASFSIYRNPLMVWLWVGGVVLVIGTLMAMWPHPTARRRKPA